MSIFEQLPETEHYYYYAFTNHDLRSYRNCTYEIPVYRTTLDFLNNEYSLLYNFLNADASTRLILAGIVYYRNIVTIKHILNEIDINFSLVDIMLVTSNDYRTGKNLRIENFLDFAKRTNIKYQI